MSTSKRKQDHPETSMSKKQKNGDKQYNNGAITYIHLKNFMDHREFDWEPSPKVNVVTGAGKSILLAISIGLGKN